MKLNQDKLLENLKNHVSLVQEKIRGSLSVTEEQANMDVRKIAKLRPDEQAVAMNIKGNAINRLAELHRLIGSPYFSKCEVVLSKTGEQKTYYFAKHHFSSESIYSWFAPVSTIRFEAPGEVTYKLPNGEIQKLTLVSKDQYMIVDGKVLFFSQEEQGAPRELIYQEHFTQQKSEFILPEIVAQMEKAQDQVIRAHHEGPLLIAGPAGSGKTTLALHRVAYLTQAPDTAESFPDESIIVFVQDNGTKEYFSHLLPGLGINNVAITTFSEWAMKILKLESYSYVPRYGESDEEMDQFEYQKIKALRGGLSVFKRSAFTTLAQAYEPYLTSESQKLFAKQQKAKVLDRFDLTILLQSHLAKHQKLETVREVMRATHTSSHRRVIKTQISYSLIVVDEFENYLPEQLAIFKKCINEKTNALLYVGDMAQQVYLGTIKDWDSIGENITPERNIRLSKVYRNTKKILTYIQSLGYGISLPAGLKDGPEVVEKITSTAEEEIAHIREVVRAYQHGSVGILAKSVHYLAPFKEAFSGEKNIHVLTMNEAQGVEFDLVCIVGVSEEVFAVKAHLDALPEHLEERKRMQKDLLYVALTRAITELHILGRRNLGEILSRLGL